MAGPVCAAAVILPPGFPLVLLNDSKVLSLRARQAAFAAIVGSAVWCAAWAWPSEIDELNILQATMLAMSRAYQGLGRAADLVLVDGNRTPDIPCPVKAVVRGDASVPEIMAAAIVAKVSRDRAMERYDWLYPEYGYGRHKGYPTAAHREACRRLGPSPIQRMSFNYSKP